MSSAYEEFVKIIALHRGATVDAVKSAIDSVSTVDPGSIKDAISFDLPEETYSEAHKKRGENIIQFLERVWRPIIERKLVTLNEVRTIDVSITDAIVNYERKQPGGQRRRIPEHLRFPKIGEVDFHRGKRTSVTGPQSPAVVGLLLQRLVKVGPRP